MAAKGSLGVQQCYQALICNKPNKKAKTYADGWIRCRQETNTTVRAQLIDGNGQTLGSVLLPTFPEEDAEGLTIWEGLYVNIDGRCAPSDLPGALGQGSQACQPPARTPAPTAAVTATTARNPTAHAPPISAPQQGSGILAKRKGPTGRGFQAPSRVQPKVPPAEPIENEPSITDQPQQEQPTLPPGLGAQWERQQQQQHAHSANALDSGALGRKQGGNANLQAAGIQNQPWQHTRPMGHSRQAQGKPERQELQQGYAATTQWAPASAKPTFQEQQAPRQPQSSPEHEHPTHQEQHQQGAGAPANGGSSTTDLLAWLGLANLAQDASVAQQCQPVQQTQPAAAQSVLQKLPASAPDQATDNAQGTAGGGSGASLNSWLQVEQQSQHRSTATDRATQDGDPLSLITNTLQFRVGDAGKQPRQQQPNSSRWNEFEECEQQASQSQQEEQPPGQQSGNSAVRVQAQQGGEQQQQGVMGVYPLHQQGSQPPPFKWNAHMGNQVPGSPAVLHTADANVAGTANTEPPLPNAPPPHSKRSFEFMPGNEGAPEAATEARQDAGPPPPEQAAKKARTAGFKVPITGWVTAGPTGRASGGAGKGSGGASGGGDAAGSNMPGAASTSVGTQLLRGALQPGHSASTGAKFAAPAMVQSGNSGGATNKPQAAAGGVTHPDALAGFVFPAHLLGPAAEVLAGRRRDGAPPTGQPQTQQQLHQGHQQVIPPLPAPQRQVQIPDQFTSLKHMGQSLKGAVLEEASLAVYAAVVPLSTATTRLAVSMSDQAAGGSQHHGGAPSNVRPGMSQGNHGTGGMNITSQGFAGHKQGGIARQVLTGSHLSAAVESSCKDARVPYFANASLAISRPFVPWASKSGGGGRGGGGRGSGGAKQKGFGRGRGGGKKKKSWDDDDGGDDEEEDPMVSASSTTTSSGEPVGTRFFLTVPGIRNRLGRNCKKHDLWFLSTHPLFQGPAEQQQYRGSSSSTGGSGTWAVRSLWHGPDQQDKFEVEIISGGPFPKGTKTLEVVAMRGPDVQTELQVAEMLHTSLQMSSVPALPTALQHDHLRGSDGPLLQGMGHSLVGHTGGGIAGIVSGTAGSPALAPLVQHLCRLHAPGEWPTMVQALRWCTTAVSSSAATQAALCSAGGPAVAGHSMEAPAGQPAAKKSRKAPGKAGKTGTDGTEGLQGGGDKVQEEGCEQQGGTKQTNKAKAQRPEPKQGDGEVESDDSGSEDQAEEAAPKPKRKRKGKQKRRRAPGEDGWDATGLPPVGSVQELVQEVSSRYHLNEDQLGVLRHVASWLAGQRGAHGPGANSSCGEPQHFGDNKDQYRSKDGLHLSPPVCLIHGPFGSGKSTLLAALVEFIASARTRLPPDVLPPELGQHLRVLIAANTNVAVDRVLVSLQARGFTSFLRVGSLRAMSKAVLPHALHAADDSKGGAASDALKEMLKEAGGEEEAAVIRAELDALKAGSQAARQRALASCPVVGSTACALLRQPALWEGAGPFPVVLLDEASQMTEPLSAVPILRGKATFLIAAGDPLQLPPVITSPALLTPPPPEQQPSSNPGPLQHQQQLSLSHGRGNEERHGLLRPLFVRLQAACGYPTHLLSLQYRCHPALSAISNHRFYGGRLRDGVTAAQRAPLLHVPLPPLVFVHVNGTTQQDPHSRSSYNKAEAEGVASAVAALLRRGVPPSEIGVIAFYKAQVACIQQGLLAMAPTATGNPPPPTGQHQQQGAASTSGHGTASGTLQQHEQEREEGSDVALSLAHLRGVQVATVDSFQGAEKEVILLATTVTRVTQPPPRAWGPTGTGGSGSTNTTNSFAGDPNRLNVALTRAKRHLLVFGYTPAISGIAPALGDVLTTCQRKQPILRQREHQHTMSPGDVSPVPAHTSASSFASPAHLLQHLAAASSDGAATNAQPEQQQGSAGAGLQTDGRGQADQPMQPQLPAQRPALCSNTFGLISGQQQQGQLTSGMQPGGACGQAPAWGMSEFEKANPTGQVGQAVCTEQGTGLQTGSREQTAWSLPSKPFGHLLPTHPDTIHPSGYGGGGGPYNSGPLTWQPQGNDGGSGGVGGLPSCHEGGTWQQHQPVHASMTAAAGHAPWGTPGGGFQLPAHPVQAHLSPQWQAGHVQQHPAANTGTPVVQHQHHDHQQQPQQQQQGLSAPSAAFGGNANDTSAVAAGTPASLSVEHGAEGMQGARQPRPVNDIGEDGEEEGEEEEEEEEEDLYDDAPRFHFL